MTIYDIAKLAGVSPSAVSKVINNKPGVSTIKRNTIQRIIDENNFSPSKGKKFSSNVIVKKGIIGILIDDPISEYQSTGVTLCQSALYEAGYETITRCADGGNSLANIMKELQQMKITAVIMMGYSFTNQKIMTDMISHYLPYTPIILVRQSTHFGLNNVYNVGVNDNKGIVECVNALVNRGRTQLALIIDQNLGEKTTYRYNFEQAMMQYEGLHYCYYDDVEYSIKGGKDMALRLYEEHPNTDGVLCIRDKVAIGLIYGLQKKGIEIPKDVSVIGKDNSRLCEASNPQLTSLDSQLYDCSLMAVQMLINVLNHRIKTHGILLDSSIVLRGTL